MGDPSRRRHLAVAAWIAAWSAMPLAWAGNAALSASLDRSHVDLGQPLTLTLSLSGDLSGVTGQPKVELPDSFQIVAQSQSSNVSIRGRMVERAVSFHYVLVAREPGTFRLGPFEVEQKGAPLTTEPLDVTVRKPVVPPGSHPSERFFL